MQPSIKSIYLLLITAMLLMGDALTAQNPFNQLTLEYWDSKKGMPHDLNLNVYQTKDGFIWTTSYSGLLRFEELILPALTLEILLN